MGDCELPGLREWLESWFAAAAADDGSDETRPPRKCPEKAVLEGEPEPRRPIGAYPEAAEYYVAIYDADGEPLRDARGEPVRSDVFLLGVRDEGCPRLDQGRPRPLTNQEKGWAANLTVGETAESQRGKKRKGAAVFHWLCDGLTSRLGADGVPRPDEHCRRCIIGRFPAPRGHPVAPTAIARQPEPGHPSPQEPPLSSGPARR